jgi:hypothetical protein
MDDGAFMANAMEPEPKSSMGVDAILNETVINDQTRDSRARVLKGCNVYRATSFNKVLDAILREIQILAIWSDKCYLACCKNRKSK